MGFTSFNPSYELIQDGVAVYVGLAALAFRASWHRLYPVPWYA
jgi:hypothetical protein